MLQLRLLNQTSKSETNEQTLINKLKGEVGQNAVNKIQRMIDDIN